MPRSSIQKRRQLGRVPLKLLVVLPALVIASGCDEAPTAPSYPFEGRWVGYFHDHSVIFTKGAPINGLLTIDIEADGTGEGSGSREVQVSPTQMLTDRITLTLEVMPDGAASGTGIWLLSGPGFMEYRNGTVTGQFLMSTRCGDGVLEFLVQGEIWHIPWHVEKEKK